MKRSICLGLVLALALVGGPAAAGKKKPKPYKSEQVSTGIPHPVAYGPTGSVNSITAKDFEQNCAEPSSNGVDGYVFAIPKEYQKIQASISAIGANAGTPASFDLDMYMYDANCTVTLASQAVATDENGVIPAGTAWVFVHNYQGEPGTLAHIELKPYK